MQLASPLIDCPPKLTNRIRIAVITSDSESLTDRNTSKVVQGARANLRQSDLLAARSTSNRVADAAEASGIFWGCDELTRTNVKWSTVTLKSSS
jgi:hypothetical protein